MTLIRFIQAASILAGMTVAGFSIQNNPVHADTPTPQFCVIASNGKTACGTLKEVERACVTTDDNKTVCGKYKSVRGEQAQQEARTPAPIAGFRKEVDKFVVTLESCKRVDESVRCQLSILNKGKERKVSLYSYGSSLVDPIGKSHSASGDYVDFGSGSSSSPTATIAPNSDLVISIVFPKIPDSAVKVQLLNLAFSGDLKPIQFRNVPISN
jgi:hypothetical protein